MGIIQPWLKRTALYLVPAKQVQGFILYFTVSLLRCANFVITIVYHTSKALLICLLCFKDKCWHENWAFNKNRFTRDQRARKAYLSAYGKTQIWAKKTLFRTNRFTLRSSSHFPIISLSTYFWQNFSILSNTNLYFPMPDICVIYII